MRTAIAIPLMLAFFDCAFVRAETVLIVLRQPEGPVGQRLASLPQSTAVPDEVRAAAERERSALCKAQRDSFDARLTAAGAKSVTRYDALDIVRADLPSSSIPALQADPAVLSVTLLSATPSTPATPTRRPDLLRSPLLSPASAQPLPMPGLPAANPTTPFVPSPNMPSPNPVMPVGVPAGAGMFQSLMGTAGQLSAQAGMAMPRSAPLMVLLAGSAQIAQIIAANHKPSCNITLETTTAKLPAGGGQGTLLVTAPASCLWQPQSNAEWLQIDAPVPTLGPGIVHYTVSAAGTARTGVITIAGVDKTTVRGKASLSVTQGN